MGNADLRRPDSRARRLLRGAGWALVATAFLQAAVLLLQRPVLGAAENLDFHRVMGPAGIRHVRDPAAFHHRFVVAEFRTAPPDLFGAFTSAAAVAWASRGLGPSFGTPAGRLDLRQTGVTYLAIAALFAASALWWGAPPLLVGLLAGVLAEPGYCLYLNSFFGDAAMLVGVFGASLWAVARGGLGPGGGPRRLAASAGVLGLALLLAGLSKELYSYLPALVAAIGLAVLAGWRGAPRRPRAVLAAVMLGAAGISLVHFRWGNGPRFPEINGYNRVFDGLLVASSRPEAVARQLGIPGLAFLAGSDYFEGRWRHLPATVLPSVAAISPLRVARLWLSEPAAVEDAARTAIAPMAIAGPVDPSYSEADPRRHRVTHALPWQLSYVRGALAEALGPWLWVAGAAVGAAAAARIAARRSASGVELAGLALLAASGWQVASAVLGDGYFSLDRHLLGARFCLDLALACGVYGGGAWLCDRAWRGTPCPGVGRPVAPAAPGSGRSGS